MLLQHCVSDDDLRAWLLGHLDDEASDRISEHLAECARCEETVASFDETADSIVRGIRSVKDAEAPVGASVHTSAEVSAGLGQIRNPWSGLDPGGSSAAPKDCVRDYEILGALGSGGMGTVYKAVHTRLQRTVAIKLLPARRLRDRGSVSRFEREMQAIGRLDHPAIVRATDAGEVDGTHFLAMDFIDGIDLSRLVKRVGPLPIAETCEIIRQAALGLQYAHDQGLIHRDIKPSNLMLEVKAGTGPGRRADSNSPTDSDGQSAKPYVDSGPTVSVKILDLGLALFGSASEAVDELTTVGQLMGTLDYMAPEQADNSHAVDARADLYSLGATMFKLLTGSAPYETPDLRSPLRKMKAIATVDAPGVQSRRAGIPDAVAGIADRLLQRNVTARFQTAAAVAELLTPLCREHRLSGLAQDAMSRIDAETDRGEGVQPIDCLTSVPPGRDKMEAPDHRLGPASQLVAAAGHVPPPKRPGRSSSVWRVLGSVAGLAAVVVASVIIWLKTDTGTVRIECVQDGIPIEIRQGAESVREMQLTAGTNEVVVRAGSYELVVQSPYDSLQVSQDTFTVQRGGVSVVKIEAIEDSQADPASKTESVADTTRRTGNWIPLNPESIPRFDDPVDAMAFAELSQRYFSLKSVIREQEQQLRLLAPQVGPAHPSTVRARDLLSDSQNELREVERELQVLWHAQRARAGAQSRPREIATDPGGEPVFEGRNFDQWRRFLETERSPDELQKAVMALCILARDGREEEAAGIVLTLIRDYPCEIGRDSPESSLITTTIRYIRGMNPVSVEPVLIKLLNDDALSGYTFEHIFNGLLYGAAGRRMGDQPQIEIGSPDRLIRHLNESVEFRRSVIQAFMKLSELQQLTLLTWLPDPGTVPELDQSLEQLLNQMLAGDEAHLQYWAAQRLAFLAPREELVMPLMNGLQEITGRNSEFNSDVILTWLALHALRDHLGEAVDQLVTLPRGSSQDVRMFQGGGFGGFGGSANPRSRGRIYDDESGIVLDAGGSASSAANAGRRLFISPRLLQVELLGSIGPAASAAAQEMLAADIEYLGGQRPDPNGEFEFSTYRRIFLLDGALDAVRTKSVDTGSRFANSPVGLAPDILVERLTSSLIAWERITGAPARFSQPEFLTAPMRNSRSGRQDPLTDLANAPQLQRFRNKTLDEWRASADAPAMTTSDIIAAAEAIRTMSQSATAAQESLEVMCRLLQRLITAAPELGGGPARLRQYAGTFLMSEEAAPIQYLLAWCYNAGEAATEDAVAELFDTADETIRLFILQEIVRVGQLQPSGSESGVPVVSAFGTAIRSNRESGARYDRLRDEWNELPRELRHAILQLELAYTTLDKSPAVLLLEPLLSSDDPEEKYLAAVGLGRKRDLPGHLRQSVAVALTDTLEGFPSAASVINAIAVLGDLMPDALPAPVADRLLNLLAQDIESNESSTPRELYFQRVRDGGQMRFIVSRRILIADLLTLRVTDDAPWRPRLVTLLQSAAQEPREGASVESPMRALAEGVREGILFGEAVGTPATAENAVFRFLAWYNVEWLKSRETQ